MDRLRLPRPDAIGHRVVHGGPNHFAPERVTPELIEALRASDSVCAAASSG